MAGGVQIYWVNQFSVTPGQPGGTRHFDMALELKRLSDGVVLVASDLSLGQRLYSRRGSSADLRPIAEEVDGVDFVWLPAGSYRRNDWRRVVSMLIFGGAAFSYLISQRVPDGSTFIGSSPHLFAAGGTWAAARVKGVSFVFEVRDLWPESYEAVSGRQGGAIIGLMRRMADFLYRHADAVVVLTEPNRDFVISRGVEPDRAHYVPNGVELAGFPQVQARRPSREGKVLFAYAGAHGPANGLETVVEACAILQERGCNRLRVLLVGDGPARETLIAQAASKELVNLEFRDPIPKGGIPSFLATVDVGLMVLAPAPLFTTGVSPNKLFDYLASNLPVLTNVPGIVSDIVVAAGAGTTCPAGDPEALADAMVRMAQDILDDPSAYRGGRQFVSEHHDRRELALRLHRILEETAVRSNATRRSRGWERRTRLPRFRRDRIL